MALNFFEMSSWKLLTLSSSMWTFLHYFFPCLLGCLLAWLVGLNQKWLFCSASSSLSLICFQPLLLPVTAKFDCFSYHAFLFINLTARFQNRPLLACPSAFSVKKCDFFHSSSSKIRALFSFNVLLLLSQTKVSAVRKEKYISFFIFKLSI